MRASYQELLDFEIVKIFLNAIAIIGYMFKDRESYL